MANALRPPATKRLYDVCVLGDGLGAAAAGALLSRRRLRVLLLETGRQAPLVHGGWLFQRRPELAPSVRQVPALEALLGELGLQNEAARTQEPLGTELQVVVPRHRLELMRQPSALLGELRREWPEDAKALAAALQALLDGCDSSALALRAGPPLPPAGFLDRWRVRRALRAAGSRPDAAPLTPLSGHPLAAALLALPGFLARLDGPVSGLAQARVCGAALRGLHRHAAGQPELAEALKRRITEARGEVLGHPDSPAKLEAIEADGRQLTTLRLGGTADVYAARAFVLAGPLAWLRPLVRGEKAEGGKPAAPGPGPGRRLAALHLVLGPGARPPGLGPAALRLGEGEGAGEAVLLELAPARRDPRAAGEPRPAGELTASLWTLAASGSGPDPAATARLEAALEELLPFHQGHLVHRHAPEPVAHLLSVAEPYLGVASPWQRSPWKNLVLGGPELLPGLGQEGEIYAATQAAGRAIALLGVKDRAP